ncbi:hypothetical protein IPG36_01485 [bacterium]|nr:MAG: hypothetical protein IPG36_01485 [bacterium]
MAYIAGSVAELFDTPPQFGHAKAIAKTHDESAKAKAAALRAAGVQVGETYAEFAAFVQALPDTTSAPANQPSHPQLTNRRPALIASTVSRDRAGQVDILGTPQLELAQQRTFAAIVAAMLLGRPNVSRPGSNRLLILFSNYWSTTVPTSRVPSTPLRLPGLAKIWFQP